MASGTRVLPSSRHPTVSPPRGLKMAATDPSKHPHATSRGEKGAVFSSCLFLGAKNPVPEAPKRPLTPHWPELGHTALLEGDRGVVFATTNQDLPHLGKGGWARERALGPQVGNQYFPPPASSLMTHSHTPPPLTTHCHAKEFNSQFFAG